MPILTVHLIKCTNLVQNAGTDVADPYVKFELEQDNMVFDKDFGEQKSTKKKNDMNPEYGEEFVYNIPEIKNMELTCTVMDDDWVGDDKLGKCKIKLEDLALSGEWLEVDRKVDDSFFNPDSWFISRLSMSREEEVRDAVGSNLSDG
eukprot:368853_1